MSDPPPLRDYGRSLAIMIGTWDYAFLERVPAAQHSLRRMEQLLTGPQCEWPRDRLQVLPNLANPGDLPDQLITAFDEVTDVALFYFVGHGQISPDDQLCLGLAHSRPEPNRRAATSLRFADVRQALQDSRAAVKIVILDCCFAGLATRGALSGLAGDVLDLTAGTGAYTMAATSAYTTAWYQDESGLDDPQTYFTKYLADLVEEGIPGQPSTLRVDPLFKQLRDNLATDGRPVPRSRAVNDAREFVFARNAAPPESQRDPQQELARLSRQLAEAEVLRAAANGYVKALQAEAAERERELERLRGLLASPGSHDPGLRRELRDAIDEAARQLDDTRAAQSALTTADPGLLTGGGEQDSPGPGANQQQDRAADHQPTRPQEARVAGEQPLLPDEAREQALRAETSKRTSELDRPERQAPTKSAMRAEEKKGLGEGVDGPQLFDEITVGGETPERVAHDVADAGEPHQMEYPAAKDHGPSVPVPARRQVLEEAEWQLGEKGIRHGYASDSRKARAGPLVSVISGTADLRTSLSRRKIALLAGVAVVLAVAGALTALLPDSGHGTGTLLPPTPASSSTRTSAAASAPISATASATTSPPSMAPRQLTAFHDPGSSPQAYALAFSPDGATLAIGDYDNSTYLWSVALRKVIATLPNPTSTSSHVWVSSVAFSPNGAVLAVGDDDNSTYLWSVATHQIIATLPSPGGRYNEYVTSVAFSPDGSTLAVGDSDGHTYLWSVATDQVISTLPSSSGSDIAVYSVAFSPDGSTLAVGNGDGQAYLWSMAASKVAASLRNPSESGRSIFSVAFSHDGTTLATGDFYGRTFLWNLATRKVTASIPTHGGGAYWIESLAFSPDGTTLAVGDANGSTYLWNVKARKISATLPTRHGNGLTSVTYNPQGTILAVGENDGRAYLWSVPRSA